MIKLLAPVLLLGQIALASPYKCSVKEFDSRGQVARTHQIEFSRQVKLETDLVGPYLINFSDYVGMASIEVFTKDVLVNGTIQDVKKNEYRAVSGKPLGLKQLDLVVECAK